MIRNPLSFRWPYQGVVDVWPRSQRDPSVTPAAQNVLPMDALGRRRGAVRPGLNLWGTDSYAGGIQSIVFTRYASGSNILTAYCVIAGGRLYIDGTAADRTLGLGELTASGTTAKLADYYRTFAVGDTCVVFDAVPTDYNGTWTISSRDADYVYWTLNSTPSGPATQGKVYLRLNPANPVQAVAAAGGYVFFVDGAGYPAYIHLPSRSNFYLRRWYGFKYDPPQDTTLVTLWRERLVLAGPNQNWYMSRSGCYGDWNYGALDAAAAVAGNAANSRVAGGISEPLKAIVPLSDDYLLLLHHQRAFLMRGDPAAGGQIVQIGEQVGIAGPNACCVDSRGIAWIAGRNGLWRTDGGPPENVSRGRYEKFFNDIDEDAETVFVAYDGRRNGLWIARWTDAQTPVEAVFYDISNGGFWPQQWAGELGPLAMTVDEHDGTIIIGGNDGHLRWFDPATVYDDGDTPFHAWCWMGPHAPLDGKQNVKLNGLWATLGERPPDMSEQEWNAQWQIQTGDTEYRALENPREMTSGMWSTDGPQKRAGVRLYGPQVMLRIGNDQTSGGYWSFEEAWCETLAGGRRR